MEAADVGLRRAAGENASAPRGVPAASMAIAAFSTIVEWYDFTLYLYMVTVLARVFFDNDGPSPLMALGGFAFSYFMRPLGAAVFGHIGDRHGRRLMLLLSMSSMTAAMLATALLPTRADIGPAAGGLMLLLRCVVAFSVGGEYTGVVAYLLEGAPRRRRGLIASLAAASSEVGGLLAAGVCAVTAASMDSAELARWGWRAPFFAGAALAGAVWLLRSTMHESPVFMLHRSRGALPLSPLRLAFDNYRGAIVMGFAISALGSITYYVGITYVPAFLLATQTMPERDAFFVATIAACAVVLVTPVVGALSDAVGRKPVLVLLCAAAVALPIAMFALMAGGSFVRALTGAVVLAALGGGVSAVGAVTSAELLPSRGRLSGLALGSTLATAIFGGATPFLSQYLIEQSGWASIPGAMIAAVAAFILPLLMTIRETRPRLN